MASLVLKLETFAGNGQFPLGEENIWEARDQLTHSDAEQRLCLGIHRKTVPILMCIICGQLHFNQK
jgi:hypothetical protein